MAIQDRPEVVRVMPGARAEPALVALMAVVVLVGAAIWKPWSNGPDTPARPVPAEVVVKPRTTPPAPTADGGRGHRDRDGRPADRRIGCFDDGPGRSA